MPSSWALVYCKFSRVYTEGSDTSWNLIQLVWNPSDYRIRNLALEFGILGLINNH